MTRTPLSLFLLTSACIAIATLAAPRFVHAAETTHECGAVDVIPVALETTFHKITEAGPVDATEVMNWAYANGLPDVRDGSEHIGNILFKKYNSIHPPAHREYIALQMMFVENDNRDGKVSLLVSLSRLTPEGLYKSVLTNKVVAPSATALDGSGMKEEIAKWVGTLQAVLQQEFMPREIKYELSRHVIDVNDPKDIEIKILEFRDKHGVISDNGPESMFCIDFELSIDFYNFKLGPKKLRDLVGATRTFSRSQQASEKNCEEDPHVCSRPTGRFDVHLTKSFGAFWDDALLKIDDKEKQLITILCPLTVTIPEPPVMALMPGQSKALPFRITTFKDRPLDQTLLQSITIAPGALGHLNKTFDATNTEGYTRELKVTALPSAQEGLTGEITGFVCKDRPSNDLGRDEEGNPIPWNVKAVQPIKITQMPSVNLFIRSIHKIDHMEDARRENKHVIEQTYRANMIDEAFTLTMEKVRLDKRTVEPNFSDDTGFKGTLIEYSGQGIAIVRMSKPVAALDMVTHRGTFKSKKCGDTPFDYRRTDIKHQYRINTPHVPVVVYYRHYIPGPGSSLQKHPMEGLGMVQRDPFKAAMSYQNITVSVDQRLDEDTCSLTTRTNKVPELWVPMLVGNFFPVSLWAFADDCYGLEELTVPFKETDYMSATLRKFDPATKKFDEVHLKKEINLTPNDAAECWEIPARTATEWHDPTLTFVKGNFSYDSSAELVDGSFDFEKP